MYWPRLAASGLVLWAGGGLAAALMCWLPHVADVLRVFGSSVGRPEVMLGVHLALAVSAAGSLALVRPHGGLPLLHSAFAMLATMLYMPLAWAVYRLGQVTGFRGNRYMQDWTPTVQQVMWMAAACVLAAAIMLLQRPMARTLVARSLVMRTGRVDRQTLAAMAIAAAIMALGTASGLLVAGAPSIWRDLARVSGIGLIGMGGLLLTMGLVGCLIDCARIGSSILAPAPTARQVIRQGHTSKSGIFRLVDPKAGTQDGSEQSTKRP